MAERQYTIDEFVTFAATLNRLLFAQAIGQTAYEGKRDYYETLGYKSSLDFDDYKTLYDRDSIAARIMEMPAEDTWKKPPKVSEDDNIETQFVKEWAALTERLRVWSMLARADRLSRIGRYGVLLIGVRDGEDLSGEVGQGSLKGQKDVLYLRPFSEDAATVEEWEDDTGVERYGLPLRYSIKLTDEAPVAVHWTRVLHLAEHKADSELFGIPALQRLINNLEDIVKFVGGGAEIAWMNRPVKILRPKEDYDFADDDDSKEARDEEYYRFFHGFAPMMRLTGVEAQEIGSNQAPNIDSLWQAEKEIISAGAGIPQRVLFGSARGELAAAKVDETQWAGMVAYRQKNYAEPEILRPFIDRLVWLGALPAPANGYDVGTLDEETDERRWPPLVVMSADEQSQITLRRANAVKALADPMTGQTKLTDGEARELLGYPAELEEEEEGIETMAVNDLASYERGIRAAVRALWTAAPGMDEFEFAAMMGPAVRNGLRQAWLEGMKKAGIEEVEMTDAEMEALGRIVVRAISAVDGFADYIQANDKASGKKLGDLNPRVAMWVNRYQEAVNQAMQMARNNPKLVWNLGPTEKHCKTCLKMQGKVKRASQWETAGVRPQGDMLECGGINCLCAFDVTDAPMSKGPLPRP